MSGSRFQAPGRKPLRRSGLAAISAIALLVVTALPALATEPVDDGTLTVTFELPLDAGGGPIEGADLTLTITRDDADVSEARTGLTDATGNATFTGLPRAIDGSPVLIDVEAFWHEPFPPGDCGEVSAWGASAADVTSDLDVALSLEGAPTTAYGCGGDGTAPDLDHVVMDGALDVTTLPDEPGTNRYFTLEATIDGGNVIWSADGWDEGDGHLAFTGLPRPDAEGPAIVWSVRAWQSEQVVVDGCTFNRGGEASADIAAAAGTSAIQLELAYRLEGESCEAPQPGSPVITGLAIDEAGGPVSELYFLTVTQVRSDGGRYQAAATAVGDGTFLAQVHAWGTAAEPSQLEVSATGPVTRTVVEDDCTTTYALLGQTTVDVALAEFAPTEMVVLTLTEDVLQSICGETDPGTGPDDGGSAGGGSIPLPATDTAPDGAPAAWLVLAALLGAAVGLVGRGGVIRPWLGTSDPR
jgi:hypothetical protein